MRGPSPSTSQGTRRAGAQAVGPSSRDSAAVQGSPGRWHPRVRASSGAGRCREVATAGRLPWAPCSLLVPLSPHAPHASLAPAPAGSTPATRCAAAGGLSPPVWGFCSNLALSFTLRERRGGSFPRSQGEEAVCSCGCSAPGARGRQAGSRQPLPQGAPSPRCQPQSFADSDRHEGR